MRRDLGRLEIIRIILHGIPSGRSNGTTEPDLSEIESQLTPTVRNRFTQKMSATLARNSYPVLFDDTAETDVPEIVLSTFVGSTGSFISNSQRLAKLLYESQHPNSPSGLLAVADTEIEGLPSLAILKLEHESGTRVAQDTYQGKPTFGVEYLENLVLTEKTRVFKAGLFVQEGQTLETVEGLVSDNQASHWAKNPVASFFLRQYLGCKLQEDPQVTTQRFFNAAEEWVNNDVPDPDKKAQYEIAILAELKGNDTTLRPRAFAERHLDVGDRHRFVGHLGDRTVPDRTFQKDITLIASRMKRVTMDLESGIAILADPETFSDKVHVTPRDDGQARIEIIDRVKHMRSRG